VPQGRGVCRGGDISQRIPSHTPRTSYHNNQTPTPAFRPQVSWLKAADKCSGHLAVVSPQRCMTYSGILGCCMISGLRQLDLCVLESMAGVFPVRCIIHLFRARSFSSFFLSRASACACACALAVARLPSIYLALLALLLSFVA